MNEKSSFEIPRPSTFLRVVAMVFFLDGELLGLLAEVLTRAQANQSASSALAEYVTERAAVLKRDTFAITEALYHTRAFFNNAKAVTGEEFRSFTRDIVARHPVILAVEWIPHVTANERANHERRARGEGLNGYRISGRNPNGALVRAPLKPDYYPIYYREPMEPGHRLLGLDLSLDKARESVLQRAVRKGELALTDPINLPQEPKTSKGFLALTAGARSWLRQDRRAACKQSPQINHLQNV